MMVGLDGRYSFFTKKSSTMNNNKTGITANIKFADGVLSLPVFSYN